MILDKIRKTTQDKNISYIIFFYLAYSLTNNRKYKWHNIKFSKIFNINYLNSFYIKFIVFTKIKRDRLE